MRNQLIDFQGLRTQDHVHVSFPQELEPLIERNRVTWKAFCTLPMEVKLSFGYQPDALMSGVGYQSPETGRDPKEHFHVRLSESEWLRAQCARMKHPVVTAFVRAALVLAAAMKPFGRSFVERTETEFQITDLAKRTMARADFWTLRFLNYLGKCSEGTIVAAKHFDKGAFTAQLYESDGGFERYTAEGLWKEVRFGNGETLVFAGLGLQYLAKCQIPAMLHQVRVNARSAECGRTSIVCFFDFEGAAYYDKATHGPTQDLPDDFNRLSFEKFRTFFIEP